MKTVQVTGRLACDSDLKATRESGAVCAMRPTVETMARRHQSGFLEATTFRVAGEASARTMTAGWIIVHWRLDDRGQEHEHLDHTCSTISTAVQRPQRRTDQGWLESSEESR